ncbi:response regulator [Acetivibrio straminisolvens]|jgi:DNA-binding response OmpR family regulator|uniref:Stage 0 sporulation protein A homolog n=1 Tax=Acetivibrio straminisolvens JCM 21531 TaxID=1294263 RepID=W4V4C0_9FIRM|nr:response regulator [Acetivibrio straminisolvens]GAE87977.1 hypothetical protein JCM21531_1390 [Acetivibrio straminisolvens JCM 21531]
MKKYNIPVIYITAKNDASSEIIGLRDGAEDYIIKPFDVLILLVRIELEVKKQPMPCPNALLPLSWAA